MQMRMYMFNFSMEVISKCPSSGSGNLSEEPKEYKCILKRSGTFQLVIWKNYEELLKTILTNLVLS